MRPGWILLLPSIFELVSSVSAANTIVAHGGYAVQIVRPGSNGKLEVVASAMEVLKQFGKLHVVSVVGEYNSGKSFLMNQLMGQGETFPIGPTTKPSTQGMWVWSNPAKAYGVEYPILFIDTEGFSAPNRNANYDSKIFAASALMSSHLLFNSMHNIDQRQIEYLELLTRLTHLFGVKTSLRDSSHNIRFPALTWVVQAFVMEIEDGMSPKAWLESLLTAQDLDDQGRRGLQHIFSSIDCQTMFIPTMKSKRMLTHLNEASQALTTDYVDDLTRLRNSIIAALKQKEKQEQVSSGPQIAALLSLIVNSANSGTLANVPSMWESFLKLQVSEAISTSMDLQQTRLAQHDSKIKPLDVKAYAAEIEATATAALKLYDQLLVGLEFKGAAIGKTTLQGKLKVQGAVHSTVNKDHIETYLKRETAQLVETFKSDVTAAVLPLSSKDLRKQLKDLQDAVRKNFDRITGEYPVAGPEHLANRMRECDAFAGDKLIQNSKLLEQITEAAMQQATQKYMELMDEMLQSRGDKCVIDKDITEGQVTVNKQAMDKFEAALGVSKGEDATPKFRSHTNEALRGLLLQVEQKNALCIKKLADKVRRSLIRQTAHALASMLKPLSPTAEAVATKAQVELRIREYDMQMADFIKAPTVIKERNELHVALKAETDNFHQDNVVAIKRIIDDPLRDALDEMRRHSSSYWTVWKFKSDCRSIAAINIKKRGSLSNEFEGFVGEAIEIWIERDVKLYADKLVTRSYVLVGVPVAIIVVAGGMLATGAADKGGRA